MTKNETVNKLPSESALVSIIIPVRNLEKFIDRCIQSIQKQSYTNYEIIAVENGSADSSWDKLLKLSSTDNRIKPYQMANGAGVSGARNFGLQKISGDYVCFVDGDDYLFPEFISLMIEPLINDKADFTICDMTYDGKKRATRSFPKNQIDFSNKSDFLLGMRLAAGSSCAKLFKRKIIQDISFKKIPIGEDSLFMLEIYTKKPVMEYVPYLGYFYYQHPASTMHDLTIAKINSNFTFLLEGKNILEKKELWNQAGSYWKSRAKTNSIERFRQIKSRDLQYYWKEQFIQFMKTDFFNDGLLKQLVLFFLKISPISLLTLVFATRSVILDMARFTINQKNIIKHKLLDRV